MESHHFGDLKDSFTEEKTNTSVEKDEETWLDCLFYFFRRKKRSSIESEANINNINNINNIDNTNNINNIDNINKLPDEIILMIFEWLPKECLVRSMLVCKRWCQIARDETLWTTLDLSHKVLKAGALGHILPRGVRILLLRDAEIMDPVFCEGSKILSYHYISKLEELHLSEAHISPVGLAAILYRCKYLKILWVDNCIINRDCCSAISENTELEELNLAMCKNLDIECIKDLMRLKRLTTLNMTYCSMDKESITLLCRTLPISLIDLNMAGVDVLDENVEDLLKRCTDISYLNLSYCTELTENATNTLKNLPKFIIMYPKR